MSCTVDHLCYACTEVKHLRKRIASLEKTLGEYEFDRGSMVLHHLLQIRDILSSIPVGKTGNEP